MGKQNLTEQIFKAKVNNVEISGKTYKEFTINYLTELVKQYLSLPNEKRLQAYLGYFLSNFNYDKQRKNEILTDNHAVTYETNEKDLFTLLHDGHGVCKQFSQAIALLSVIDQKITKTDYFTAVYATCPITQNGKEMGHAINLCNLGDNKAMIIDVSSMIHARDKDYKLDICCFGPVSVEEYMSNFSKVGCQILPQEPDANELLLACYKIQHDPDLMYQILNLTANVLNNNIELNRAATYTTSLPNIYNKSHEDEL